MTIGSRESQLQSAIVVVDEEPYCIWGWDLEERNKLFLDGFDTDYFPFLISTLASSDDSKRAPLALRATLHHSLETFFSLVGALVQSPKCAYGWIAKCSNVTLRKVVHRIDARDCELLTPFVRKPAGWDGIAELVFACYMPDTEKGAATKKLFAALWGQLAREFLNRDHADEYNSIKHGLRMRGGGFTLAVGTEPSYGVPPPSSEMRTIGHSAHGSSFFRLERIGEESSRSFSTRRISLNWKVEKVQLLCELVAMSIANVVGALRIVNGAAPSTIQFQRPTDDQDFTRAWSYSPGVTSMNMDFVIDPQQIPKVTKALLLEQLRKDAQ